MKIFDFRKGETGLASVVISVCAYCGDENRVKVSYHRKKAWQQGAYAQDAFNNLTPDERELLISGTHPECWDRLMNADF